MSEQESRIMDVAMSEINDIPENPSPTSNGNVQVIVRVRPPNNREENQGYVKCAIVEGTTTVTLAAKPQTRSFTFDFAADEHVQQAELFTAVGKPIADACMQGYHCCLLAYGQTGAGKTFTMEGPDAGGVDDDKPALEETLTGSNLDKRGLIPRVLQYIFEKMSAEKEQNYRNVEFAVKCSYLQIYNEQVSDLLEPESNNLNIREDSKRGIFVDGIQEVVVSTAEATYSVFKRGSQNRRVGMTAMNMESSRSHSVFTIVVESQRRNEGGVMNRRTSRFYLVDLAGSERQKHSEATGVRLKEAGSINKSLSALGNVIKALVDTAEGKLRHVPYRDSKLTFLLKDALGGNSKCSLVANISPAEKNIDETLSTLKFAQRAKLMRNTAVVNEDMVGNPAVMGEEIRRLRLEIAFLRANLGGSAINEHPHNGISEGQTESARLSRLEHIISQQTMRSLELERKAASESKRHVMHAEAAQALNQRLEYEIKNLRMLIKLKEGTIKRYTNGVAEASGDEAVDELREELEIRRKQVDRHPDVIRFKMELDSAREQLEELEDERNNEDSLRSQIEQLDSLNTALRMEIKESYEERRKLETEHAKVLEENHTFRVKLDGFGEQVSKLTELNRSYLEEAHAAKEQLTTTLEKMAAAEEEQRQALRQLDLVEANAAMTAHQLSKQKLQAEKLQAAFNEQSKFQDDLMKELQRVSEASEKAAQANANLSTKLKNKEGELEAQQSRVANAEAERFRLTALVDDLNGASEQMKAARLVAEQQLAAITAEKDAAKSQVETIRSELLAQKDEVESELNSVQGQLASLHTMKEAAEAATASAEEQSKELENKVGGLEESLSAAKAAEWAAKTALQAQGEAARVAMEEAQQQHKQLAEQLILKDTHLTELESQCSGSRGKIDELQRELEASLASASRLKEDVQCARVEKVAAVQALERGQAEWEAQLRKAEELEKKMAQLEVEAEHAREKLVPLEELQRQTERDRDAALAASSGNAEKLVQVEGRLAALKEVLNSEQETTKLQLEAKEEAIMQMSARVERIEQEKSRIEASLVDLARQVGEREGKLAVALDKLQQAETEALRNSRLLEEEKFASEGLKNQIERLQVDLHELKQELQRANDKRLTAEGALQEAEKGRKVAVEETERLHVTLTEKREEMSILAGQLAELESEEVKNREATEWLRQALCEERQALRAAERGCTELKATLEDTEARLAEVSQRLVIAESAKTAAAEELGQAQDICSVLQKKVVDTKQQLAEVQKKQAETEEAKGLLENSVIQLSHQVACEKEEIDDLRTSKGQLEQLLETEKAKVAAAEMKTAVLEARRLELVAISSANEEMHAQLGAEKAALQSRCGELEKATIASREAEAKLLEKLQGMEADAQLALMERLATEDKLKLALESRATAEQAALLTQKNLVEMAEQHKQDMAQTTLALQKKEEAERVCMEVKKQKEQLILDLEHHLQELQESNKKQAEEMRNVLELKTSMETELQNTIQENNHSLVELQANLDSLSAAYATVQREEAEARSHLNALSQELAAQTSGSSEALSQAEARLRSLEEKCKRAECREEEALATVQALRDEMKRLDEVATTALTEARQKVVETQADCDELKKKEGAMSQKLEELERRIKDQEEAAAETMRTAEIEKHHLKETSRREMDELRTSLRIEAEKALERQADQTAELERSTEVAVQNLMTRKLQQEAQLKEQRSKIKELEAQVEHLKWEVAQVEGLEREKAVLTGKVKRATKEVASLRKAVQELRLETAGMSAQQEAVLSARQPGGATAVQSRVSGSVLATSATSPLPSLKAPGQPTDSDENTVFYTPTAFRGGRLGTPLPGSALQPSMKASDRGGSVTSRVAANGSIGAMTAGLPPRSSKKRGNCGVDEADDSKENWPVTSQSELSPSRKPLMPSNSIPAPRNSPAAKGVKYNLRNRTGTAENRAKRTRLA